MKVRHPRPDLEAMQEPHVGDVGRCSVPGCGGIHTHTTDGNGRVIWYCEDCERRVRQLALLLSGRRPAPPPAPRLTDAMLGTLIRERCWTPEEAREALTCNWGTLRDAIEAGTVASLRVSSRWYLVFRDSAEAWAKQRRRHVRRGGYLLHIPTTPDAALTCRQLAEASGIPMSRWSVWLATMGKALPTIRRHEVREGSWTRYAYWREATADELRPAAHPSHAGASA